ncbi:MAG: single-stranded-DNA-specific exonuclease RecJ [Candidatus Vogelbacteria bacterium]|nr:single-stranded-DNA-specific exonuclease RecJ [Candidatus Vogelbacteria bacterium]
MEWKKKDLTLPPSPLVPDYERDLLDPFLFKGMDKAVERILTALTNKEKIIIFGDYDADGVPATALLASFFNQIGFTFYDIFIPDRHLESYGLSLERVKEFAADDVKLIITVDCGITDIAEVDLANKQGIDVIITDHHLPPAVRPAAEVIINAKQADDRYPFKELCGSGVAFKLVQALITRGNFNLPKGWEKWLLDLVAVATISDMVPLTGENRVLTHFGLIVLRKTKRVGLKALLAALKLNPRFVTEDDIGFMVGPRINSASRMGHASEAYNLLMTEDVETAATIAKNLDTKNTARKGAVENILKAVEGLVGTKEPLPVLVVGQNDFSPGILGLVASRLVEKYRRPAFVWGKTEFGEIKGSGRSDGSVNLVELMRAAGDNLFSDLGGHVMAAGFTLLPGKEGELNDKLNAVYNQVKQATMSSVIFYDRELTLDGCTEATWRVIEQWAPFGVGNTKPVFLFNKLKVFQVKMFGNGGIHLELTFKTNQSKNICAIGFFYTKDLKVTAGETIDLLATMEKSYFRGIPELRLRIVDLKKA